MADVKTKGGQSDWSEKALAILIKRDDEYVHGDHDANGVLYKTLALEIVEKTGWPSGFMKEWNWKMIVPDWMERVP